MWRRVDLVYTDVSEECITETSFYTYNIYQGLTQAPVNTAMSLRTA
jgi:hypothetical protein